MATIVFPNYDFTFVIEQLLFEQGSMVVKYTPTDVRLTSISYAIPLLPTIDFNNLKAYVAEWAPKDKWFAQQTILESSNQLLNAAG